ncbi:MAG: hypothetical protein ACRELY_23155 [Polyangiaceae bacterium]
MSAQRTEPLGQIADEILDADTSAALLHWMETAHLPEGVDVARWEEWIDGGCKTPLVANGKILTSAMLGSWARAEANR